MKVRTRFAPSPTGNLHIGAARTALFNYLFAKKHGGDFLLRIEDTDFSRSNENAKRKILASLDWLDIKYDEDIVYQSMQIKRHIEIAEKLLSMGKAYYCFTPQEEINKLREEAKKRKESFIFRSKWRNLGREDHPQNQKPVIRLKAPQEGESTINDLLQGLIVVKNSHLDDMIILRSDKTPTYMLAVAVDDHDMKITHIIRGDDHLTNATRQKLIYDALGWNMPNVVHIPLIYGVDGKKLSKRHGAVGADDYKKMGYLPDALNNYLLRLGWSHGDDEIISRKQALEWFDIKGLGKSPARLDFNKMRNINAHYLRQMNDDELSQMVFDNMNYTISGESKKSIKKAMGSLKVRAELITDLLEMAQMFVIDRPLYITEDAKKFIQNTDDTLRNQILEKLENITNFNKKTIQISLKQLADENGLKLGALMKHVRAFIAGRTTSPSVFEMMEILGKDNSVCRLKR